MALLEVEDLRVSFASERGPLLAVDGISFQLAARETLGVVGESGCGKSITGLSIMRLLPPVKLSGAIRFAGEELLQTSEAQMRRIRGGKIAMIFQEPMTSLNPVFTVGSQIVEAITLHQGLSNVAAWQRAVEMLNVVGIASPQAVSKAYPHELSGGMRQRVMIAMALSCNPELLIADEPTTALDVTIQAQILELLKELQQKYQMGILLITHNLGVVAAICQRVMVMYAGSIVEMAAVQSLYDQPRHPYTQGLYASLPKVARAAGAKRLHAISGSVPELGQLPSGCRFRNRCPIAKENCASAEPPLRDLGDGHWVRCFYA